MSVTVNLENISPMDIDGYSRQLVSYVQGQSPKPNTREYFYYVDHQGMLFLDDSRMKNFTSCFKETDFLVFFFTRLRINKTGRYEKDFPYVSPCGVEMNYVRCDDRPVVFTHFVDKEIEEKVEDYLAYAHAGNRLMVKFEPERLCMLPKSGRVYHPASPQVGNVGLIKSSLAFEISKLFTFENGETQPPTHFRWKNKVYKLTNELWNLMDEKVKSQPYV
uniref:Uncharacterized protein n=1 Tax=Strigamia maritima TaxID=126957 RepID=T1ISW4_STRMM